MATFGLGILLFTLIVLVLVGVILAARSQLVSSGNVNITINGEKTVSVPAGGKLLQTLAEQKLFVPINAAMIVFINALTGILIWEDWRVVQSWLGYACVFLLLDSYRQFQKPRVRM